MRIISGWSEYMLPFNLIGLPLSAWVIDGLACSNLLIWVLKLSEHRWSYYQECITRIWYPWLDIAKKTTVKCWFTSFCIRALYENTFMVCSCKLYTFCENLRIMCQWNSILFSTQFFEESIIKNSGIGLINGHMQLMWASRSGDHKLEIYGQCMWA